MAIAKVKTPTGQVEPIHTKGKDMIKARVIVNPDTNIVSIKIYTDIYNGAIIIDELSTVCGNLAQAHLSLGHYPDAVDMQKNSEYLCTKFVDLMEGIEKDESSTKDKESGRA